VRGSTTYLVSNYFILVDYPCTYLFGDLLSSKEVLRKPESPLLGGLWLFGVEEGILDEVADIVIPTLVKAGAVATAVDMLKK
jgi:hypothetical protein